MPLVVLALVAFLPGFFSLPVIDRDEARFAQASRQMYESLALPAAAKDPALHAGGAIVPYVQDRPRLNKPPVIYWLQSASAAALTLGDPTRDAIWMYRLPSILAAIASVLLTWKIGSSMFGDSVGRLGATLLAVAPVIAWEAHQARADMVLVAFTLAAMWALWEVFRRATRAVDEVSRDPDPGLAARLGFPALFWLALAGGILTKGPITPMVAGFTCVGVSLLARRWRWMLRLRPALGALVLVASVGPWVYGVANHVGFDRYLSIIGDEVLGRSVTPKEGHWGPVGYHLLLLSVIFWPGAMLAGLGVILAVRHGLRPRGALGASRVRRVMSSITGLHAGDPALVFCLAWLVPSWIVFELVSTKLPHYTMPLLPAVALLAARAVIAADAGLVPDIRTRVTRIGLQLWFVIGVALAGLTLAIFAYSLSTPRSSGALVLLVVFALGGPMVSLALLVGALRAIRAGAFQRAQTAGVLAMLPLLVALAQFLLPAKMGLSAQVARELEHLDPSSTRPLAMVGYHEDSMVFHTRGRITRLDPPKLSEWLARNPRGIVLVRRSVPLEPIRVETLATFEGFNYSRGHGESLALVELAGPR